MTTLKTLDYNAARLVTPGFREGSESPSFADYERDLDVDHPVDLDAIRTVLDEAMRRFGPAMGTEADMWLAPRLHFALRLTRREAARRDLWRWFGCVFAPDYVRWRWGSPDGSFSGVNSAATNDRFVGPDYKQALARLWWMAELFRDGPDYSPVVQALGNQDVPNNLFRMDIAHHRPTVQAAVRVLEGRSGDEANALAKATNSAATTLVVDTIAPDTPLDPEAQLAWVSADDVDVGRFLDEIPPGPTDPVVGPVGIEKLVELMTALLDEAPVRDRSRPRETKDSQDSD
ncbi:MAG: DUF6339 family protein [Acidimicrobiales bacterium]